MTTAGGSGSDEPALTLTQAAERLGVHYMTAYRYVRTGRLDAHRAGGRWMVPTQALQSMLTGGAPRSGEHGDDRRESHRRALIHALVAGDEATAWATIEAAMRSGATTDEIDLELIVPAMHTIGDDWARGDLTVADEHRATSVVQRLIGVVGSRTRRRGRRRGSIVLATVAGDHHGLATAVLRGLWSRRGFDVVDLGANTPADSIVTSSSAPDVLAVGVSATTPGNEAAIVDALAALADAYPAVPRLLGGQAIEGAEHAAALGGDHYDATGQGTLALLDELSARPGPS